MKISRSFGWLLAGALALGACSPAPVPGPTQDLTAVHTQAAQTVMAELTRSASEAQVTTPAQIIESPTVPLPPSATPIPASETPLPATDTPSPTPAPLPSPTLSARLVLEADFSTGRGWHTEENDRFHFAFQDGGYVIGVDIRNAAIWSIRDEPYTDVILETSAQRLNGPQDGYYGVVCRHVDEDNYYGLVIGSDGAYGILKMMDGKMDFLVEGTAPAGAIQAGEPNLLRAECIGENLALYANGQKLAETQDSDLESGATGMLAGTRSNPGFEALFKTFKVYQP